MALRQRDGAGVRFDIDGMDRPRECADSRQGLSGLLPIETEFSTRDVGELVENLDADIAALAQQRFRRDRSVIVGESVNKDIRIEEGLRH